MYTFCSLLFSLRCYHKDWYCQEFGARGHRETKEKPPIVVGFEFRGLPPVALAKGGRGMGERLARHKCLRRIR